MTDKKMNTTGAKLVAAAARIEQLQSENTRLKLELEIVQGTKDALENDLINADMNLEHMTAERDKAVEDLHIGKCCSTCANTVCDMVIPGTIVHGCGSWQYRGLEESE